MQTLTTDREALVRLRVERGLSQSALAELAHVKPNTINRIEAGERGGRADTLKAIADALGCTVADITEAVTS